METRTTPGTRPPDPSEPESDQPATLPVAPTLPDGDGMDEAATRQFAPDPALRTTVVNIASARRPQPIRAIRDFLPNIGLDDRLGRLLLSVVLALLLWFYVT